MPVSAQTGITLREATVAEKPRLATGVRHRAFSTINAEHNFPSDLPNAEVAIGLLTMIFGHPGFY